MIATVGDLLQALIASERQKLAEYSFVKHPGIIGDMYEGLARKVLKRALVGGADLRVVRGKIRGRNGELSRQIDCMIVEGDGECIPHTDHWIYDFGKTLAVIEVKKTLYRDDLSDAIDLMTDLWRRLAEPREMPATLLRDAWRSIHGTELPARNDLRRLKPAEELLYHALTVEANLPVRIVLGFEGYNSEAALRRGLFELLQSRLAAAAGVAVPLGPISFPSLVISKAGSLIKLNGMPYPGPYWISDYTWGFYGSRAENPIHVLLEVLWTRLTYYHGASSSLFGEDLELEGVNLLLRARPTPIGQQFGWALDCIDATEEELTPEPSVTPWGPAILSKPAFILVNKLCREGEVDLSDETLRKFLRDAGTTPEHVVAELQAAHLAYVDGDRLRLLTDQCECVIVPGVGFVAAENKSGRLERWLVRRLRTVGS